MLTFLPNNQIWILTFENIINNILFPYFDEIVFEFIHEGVEKLIDVHLDSGIDWLSVGDEGLAEGFRCEHLTIWVF